MMLHDGVVTLTEGSWLATANYVGYLVGAWPAWPALAAAACMNVGTRRAWRAPAFGGHGAADPGHGLPLPDSWPALRFAAGVASAFVLLNTAAWAMVRPRYWGARPWRADFLRPGVGICAHQPGDQPDGAGAVGARHRAGWC